MSFHGGYIPEHGSSAAVEPSPGVMASPGGKRGFSNSSIRPVTIKALAECQVTTDNQMTVDGGQEASSVHVYGCLRSVKEAQNYVDYQVEDGTGSIFIRHWAGNDKAPPQEPVQVGQWVKAQVTAKMSAGGSGKIAFNASHITPVPDWNEVSFHFLHCIHVHLHSTGQLSKAAPLQMHAVHDGYPPAKVPHLEAAAAGSVSGSLSPLHTAIMRVYGECKAPEGLHIAAIIRRLQDKYSEDAIRQGNSFLLEEGYLYQTIDNDHSKNVMES